MIVSITFAEREINQLHYSWLIAKFLAKFTKSISMSMKMAHFLSATVTDSTFYFDFDL